jgi:hypothetical protein
MSELSDDLRSGESSVQIRVGNLSSLVTMNSVGYDCWGEDGRLSIGLLLPTGAGSRPIGSWISK